MSSSPNNLYIKSIFPTNSIVEVKCNKKTTTRCFYDGLTEEDINFFYSYYKDIDDMIIHWIPSSNLVYLTKNKYNKWGDKYYYQYEGDIEVIIRSDTHFNLYEILNYYRNGYNLVSRIEKFRNLYLAYEQLTTEIELSIRSIRHSFSHSRTKLTNKKITDYLITNFGDVKINLKKYSHNKKFYEIYRTLGEHCESLIIKKILDIIPNKPNLFDKYYCPSVSIT